MTLKTHNRYIVIEGIDGSGKDTLVDHLWQHLILDTWIGTAEPAHTSRWREDSPILRSVAEQTATAEAMNALHDAIRVLLRTGVVSPSAFDRWSRTNMLSAMFLENRMLQDTLVSVASSALARPVHRVQVRSFISTAVYNHPNDVDGALDRCLRYGISHPTDVVFLDIDPAEAAARIAKRGSANDVFEASDRLSSQRGCYRQARAWLSTHAPDIRWHDVVVTRADTPESVARRVRNVIGV